MYTLLLEILNVTLIMYTVEYLNYIFFKDPHNFVGIVVVLQVGQPKNVIKFLVTVEVFRCICILAKSTC